MGIGRKSTNTNENRLYSAMEAAHKLGQQNNITNQPEPVVSASTRANARSELSIQIKNLHESTGEHQGERIEGELTKTNQAAIQDIFRAGKFKQGSPRPRTVIVRLTNAWQYRQILASCHRLKETQFDAYCWICQKAMLDYMCFHVIYNDYVLYLF